MKDILLDRDLDIKDLGFGQGERLDLPFDAQRELTAREWEEMERYFISRIPDAFRYEEQSEVVRMGFYLRLLDAKRFNELLADNLLAVDVLKRSFTAPLYATEEYRERTTHLIRGAHYKLTLEVEEDVFTSKADHDMAYKYLEDSVKEIQYPLEPQLSLATLFIGKVLFPEKYQDLMEICSTDDAVDMTREVVLPQIRRFNPPKYEYFGEIASLSRLCYGLVDQNAQKLLGITKDDWARMRELLRSLRIDNILYRARLAAFMQILSASYIKIESPKVEINNPVEDLDTDSTEKFPNGRDY